MNRSLVLFSVLILSLALVTSTIVGNVYAGSEKNIVKAIKKDAGSFKKVCEVWIKSVTDKTLHKVYVKSNSVKCDTAIPPVPVNQPPVLVVDSPIKCVAQLDCTLTIEEVSDPDGNVTQIIFNQESGPNVGNITVGEGNLSAVFVPPINATYGFSVEAIDNNGSSTLKPIVVNVGEDPKPPVGNTSNIILVGDFGGTSVTSAAAKANPELFVALGDLFYGSNLGKYNTQIKTVFGDSSKCVIGNHDASEDGSGDIIEQALSECKQLWSREVANNNTVVIGFNSNGNINNLINGMQQISVSDSVKNVVIASHKPCSTSPDSHHPVSEDPQVKQFCDAVKERFADKNVIEVSGHNHQMAGTEDGKSFVSGAGGRSHYVCNTDATWTFCNNQKYGYLELVIDNNTGDLSSRFVDTNGQVLRQW